MSLHTEQDIDNKSKIPFILLDCVKILKLGIKRKRYRKSDTRVMGSCLSASLSSGEDDGTEIKEKTQQTCAPLPGAISAAPTGVPSFREFSLGILKTATKNFSTRYIISGSGERARNIVYRGRLDNRRWIAIKEFPVFSWPDAEQFKKAALRVGKLRHLALANLIGYCCAGDERLLVAEYMPNETLSKRLFHREGPVVEWTMRCRVAFYIARCLEYCFSEGHLLEHDLNSSRILFDQDANPSLSCFCLMKNSHDGRSRSTNLAYTPPEYLENGMMSQECTIYCFGTVLFDLLSGQHIPPSQAQDMIRDKNIFRLVDAHLEGNFSVEEATVVAGLASQCLQNDPSERPTLTDILTTLSSLQLKEDDPSYELLGIPMNEEAPPSPQRPLSTMGEACLRMDLMAVHQLLVAVQYRDDRITKEFSFVDWTQLMRESKEARKQGDLAFEGKDFKASIKCYSQFIDAKLKKSPTVYARRCLCYLICDDPDAALGDAMQAQMANQNWPTAYYLQSVALAKKNMHQDAEYMLKEGAKLEDKWKKGEEEQSE